MNCSIRARLTLSYGIVMTLALMLFGAGVLWLQARRGYAQFDSELSGLNAAVSRVMQEELGESSNLQQAVAETNTSINVPGRATAILDVNGRPLAAHFHGLPVGALPLTVTDVRGPYFVTLNENGKDWRILLQRAFSPTGDYIILIAGPLDEVAQQQAVLARMLFGATPLIVLVTAGVCWLVASSALRPVTMMAAQAETITAHSVDQRLETPTRTDELGQLARAFNRLLARLGTALQTQQRFMADASHELRTPVSVIRTAAEVTLEREVREDWEYREALTIVTEQSARLTRIVGNMLVLARADAGAYRLAEHSVYLDEVVAECGRAAAILAATRGTPLATAIQPDVVVIGDDGLLRELMTNLLDNAVQYTPPGGLVSLALAADASHATITVADTGPGIPAADRERIFERFVRLDSTRSTSGAGLGLPIARWIAEQHGGTLTVEDNMVGGCTFVVRVPLRRTQEGSDKQRRREHGE